MTDRPKTVSLFIPCLVDQIYPQIGIAMAKILRHLGYQLIYNDKQTCCGQPAFNAGNRHEALKVANGFIRLFAESNAPVVSPSGSCTAMIRNYYPVLYEKQPQRSQAVALGKKVFEFSEFLEGEDQIKNLKGNFKGKVGFHNSCHSYRELGIVNAPLRILNQITALEVVQPPGEPVCCGFGGLFSVKFADIGATMARTRIEMFTSMGIDTIVTNDPGCLMHMRQEAIDQNMDIRFYHLTEFLAEAMDLK
ncbi:MAG: (Fe-S)-binding protein [Calditrichales bacterium]|nr:MAG: (Fe-S)-binding protein [Calditrichales bacterium]